MLLNLLQRILTRANAILREIPSCSEMYIGGLKEADHINLKNNMAILIKYDCIYKKHSKSACLYRQMQTLYT